MPNVRTPGKGGIGNFRPPKPPKQKPMLAAPRLRPMQTRDYGKGGTPLSGGPDTTSFGAGIGPVPMGFNKSGGI